MECAAKSGERDIAEELLEFFIEEGKKECFAACICTCYDLLKPDYVLEKAWMNGLSEYVMPYMIQVVREYSTKVDELVQDKIDKQNESKQEELNKEKEQMQQNLYAQLMPAGSVTWRRHGRRRSIRRYGWCRPVRWWWWYG